MLSIRAAAFTKSCCELGAPEESLSHISLMSSVVVGDVRVTALSPQLVRGEPRGSLGFEDRTTFMAVGRQGFAGLPLKQVSATSAGTLLRSEHYEVLVKPKMPPVPVPPPSWYTFEKAAHAAPLPTPPQLPGYTLAFGYLEAGNDWQPPAVVLSECGA